MKTLKKTNFWNPGVKYNRKNSAQSYMSSLKAKKVSGGVKAAATDCSCNCYGGCSSCTSSCSCTSCSMDNS